MAVSNISGQASLVMNGAYVVMNGGVAAKPIYLVLHNGAASAITYNSGGIISESEYNMVWWDIGTNTGTYTVPFQYSTTRYIPLTFNNAGGAGVTSGTIKFSTWHTVADNWTGVVSSTGPPSDVTNMYPATGVSLPSATDDSYYVVDRFWVIDPTGGSTPYTTLPNPILTFTYINTGTSEVAAPNAAIDGTLLAQRFNNTALKTWGDWFGPAGHDNAAFGVGTGQVTTNTQIGTANFFRSWTLSDKNAPLPIELESFTANCNNYYALLQWKTASESNNDYFTIDRTQDGVHFETVAVVKGSGTTSTAHSYSTIDYTPLSGSSYYRISQTDLDGVTTNLNSVVYVPCENAESVNAFTVNNNTIDVQINSNSVDTYTITLMNAIGQVISTQTHNVSVGLNDFKLNPQVARGIYILQIVGKEKVYRRNLLSELCKSFKSLYE